MDQPSNRFLSPEELARRGSARPDQRRARGPGELFAEGQWPVIRAQLESDGWNPSQIEMLHDQLRRGWPLAVAKRNVTQLSGHCPLHARSDRRFL
jgi:hypothetical protein